MKAPGGGGWSSILSAIPGKLVELALGSTKKIFGFDSGGWLMPGATLAVNKTGQPEAVLTADQWDSLSAPNLADAMREAINGATLTLHGVDYLSNAVAGRLEVAIARGV